MSSDSNSDTVISTHSSDNSKDNQTHIKFLAVIRALLANLGIATVKLICFFVSSSSALLSEAAHSLVDSFNSVCLLVGLKRGSRPADDIHPFGYGLEANIWALFASILMLAGTSVALYSGFDKLINGHHEIDILLNNYTYIAITLGVSILFEMWSVNSAVNAVLAEANIASLNPISNFILSCKNIRKIKSPTTKFVWYEDVAALSGVVIAIIALSISKFVLPKDLAYLPDAIASIIIGTILLCLAIYLLRNNVNFLTGQSAEPHVEEIIKDVASTLHGIACVHELKTMDMGSSGLIVNIKIEVDPEIQVKDADDIAEMLERKIRHNIKNVSHVSVEILADDAEDNWENKFDKVIKEGQEISVLDSHEATMLSNFYSFSQTVVREIMIPRTKVSIIDSEDSLEDLINLIIESGHTRIPIYEDNVDNLIGVINAKDALKALQNKQNDTCEIKSLARDLPIIPENKFISDLLSDFTSSKNQIAAVVDEHGGFAGIVTVEDILEEIVGEIYDEFDEAPPAEIIKINENTVNVSAHLDIEDINEKWDLDIPNEDFQTLAGYVFGLLGREPEVGDIISDKNITYTITELDGRRISRIIMKKDTPFVDVIELQESEEKEVNETL